MKVFVSILLSLALVSCQKEPVQAQTKIKVYPGPGIATGGKVIVKQWQNTWRYDTTIAPVFVIVGQSNASGLPGPNNQDSLPSSWLLPQTNIKVWWTGDYSQNLTGHFENMQVPTNTTQKSWTDPSLGTTYTYAGWGVEQTLAHAFQTLTSKTIYVIKTSSGGTAITPAWDYPSGSMWVQGKQYIDEATTYLASIGKTPHFIIVWLQGESDAANSTLYNAYQTNLTSWETNFRAINTYLTNADIYYVKLATTFNSYSPGGIVVNNAFDYRVTQNVHNHAFTPEAAGAPLRSDLTHFLPTGYINLGYYIYNDILNKGL